MRNDEAQKEATMSEPTRIRLSRRGFLAVLATTGCALPLLASCGGPTSAPSAAPTTAPAAAAPTTAAAPTAAPKPVATAVTTSPSAATTSSPDDNAFAAAAAPFKGRKVTIMMSAGPWGKSHAQMLDRFNKLTGINVVYDVIPEADIFTKLQPVIMSRSGEYDAVVMIWDSMAQYIKAGLIADLSTYVNETRFPKFDMNEYPDPIKNFLTYDGKVWGIPVAVAAQIGNYRKDLFDKAGLKPPTVSTSWQDVSTQAKALTKDGIVGVVMEMKAGQIYNELLNSLPPDKPFLDEKKRLSILRDPQVISNVATWVKMLNEGLMQKDVLATSLEDAWAKFANGGYAWQPLSWPTEVATLVDPKSSKVADTVGFAPIPVGTPRIGGWACTILSDSKEKEAAYLHLDWLAGTQNSLNEVVELGNLNSANTKYIRAHADEIKPKILAGPNGAAIWEGLQAGWASIDHGRMSAAPGVPEFSQMGNEIYPFLAKIMSGTLSPTDGMNQAADAGDALLKKAGY